MKDIRYQQVLGSTVACTKRMMEKTKGLVQKSKKGGAKYFFLFDSWFASKKAEEAEMELGAELIGMVKTNTKDSARRQLRSLQRIGLEVPTLC